MCRYTQDWGSFFFSFLASGGWLEFYDSDEARLTRCYRDKGMSQHLTTCWRRLSMRKELPNEHYVNTVKLNTQRWQMPQNFGNCDIKCQSITLYLRINVHVYHLNKWTFRGWGSRFWPNLTESGTRGLPVVEFWLLYNLHHYKTVNGAKTELVCDGSIGVPVMDECWPYYEISVNRRPLQEKRGSFKSYCWNSTILYNLSDYKLISYVTQ